jgi:hypothetical protein
MPITARLISQSFAEGSSPALIQTYRMESTASLAVNNASDYALLLAAVPGGAYHLKPFLSTPTDASRYGRLRLRSINAVPLPATNGKIVDLQLRWDSMYVWAEIALDEPPTTSQLALPVEVDWDATPRSVTMYRSPISGAFTTPPSADLITTTDIGGTKVDYASKPLQAIIPAITVRISLVLDVSRASPGMTLVSLYDRVSSHQGRWNSAAFLHWNANEVYCESASVSPIRDEFYRATYLFKWDRWYGCEQVPKTDVNGRAAVDSNGASNVVTWKSFARGTVNHNSIFNDQPNPTLSTQWAKEGSWLTFP